MVGCLRRGQFWVLAAVAFGLCACEEAGQKSRTEPMAATTTAHAYVSQQQPILQEAAVPEKPVFRDVYTPSPGSAERVALMNILRPSVYDEMGGHVVFVVDSLRSNSHWAFGELEPSWPDGQPIDVRHSPAYRQNSAIKTLRTEVIWRKVRGRWQVVAYRVGASDEWWLAHCADVPRGILRGCPLDEPQS